MPALAAQPGGNRYTKPKPNTPQNFGLLDVPGIAYDQISHSVGRGARVISKAATQAREAQGRSRTALHTGAVYTGGAASGLTNTFLRPAAKIEDTLKHPGQALRIGPIRAITGIAAGTAAACSRILLGKDHHKRNDLNWAQRAVLGLKNSIYGAHRWAMKDYNFKAGEQPQPNEQTATTQQNQQSAQPTPESAQRTRRQQRPQRPQASRATTTPTAQTSIITTTIPLSTFTPSRSAKTPASASTGTRVQIAACFAKCTKSKACSHPKPGCPKV